MFIRYLILLLSLLLIIINADVNTTQHSTINIAVAEHGSNDAITNNPLDQSSKKTTEKILIRIPRLNADSGNIRHRRQFVDTDEIWGMARKVAITVFVAVSLCIVCCIVTTIYICAKCCCGGKNNRKRNQGFTAVPQPIIIHTGSPNYQPQFQQQQQAPPTQTWSLENHPMLPRPSAPPQPMDEFHMERPPPYEKICANR